MLSRSYFPVTLRAEIGGKDFEIAKPNARSPISALIMLHELSVPEQGLQGRIYQLDQPDSLDSALLSFCVMSPDSTDIVRGIQFYVHIDDSGCIECVAQTENGLRLRVIPLGKQNNAYCEGPAFLQCATPKWLDSILESAEKKKRFDIRIYEDSAISHPYLRDCLGDDFKSTLYAVFPNAESSSILEWYLAWHGTAEPGSAQQFVDHCLEAFVEDASVYSELDSVTDEPKVMELLESKKFGVSLNSGDLFFTGLGFCQLLVDGCIHYRQRHQILNAVRRRRIAFERAGNMNNVKPLSELETAIVNATII